MSFFFRHKLLPQHARRSLRHKVDEPRRLLGEVGLKEADEEPTQQQGEEPEVERQRYKEEAAKLGDDLDRRCRFEVKDGDQVIAAEGDHRPEPMQLPGVIEGEFVRRLVDWPQRVAQDGSLVPEQEQQAHHANAARNQPRHLAVAAVHVQVEDGQSDQGEDAERVVPCQQNDAKLVKADRVRIDVLDHVVKLPPRMVRVHHRYAIDEQLELEVATRAARQHLGLNHHPLLLDVSQQCAHPQRRPFKYALAVLIADLELGPSTAKCR